MTINMKTLAETQLQEIVNAGELLQKGELTYQQVQEVYLRNREICRVVALQNKIAEAAKKSPSKSLLEYAGISDL